MTRPLFSVFETKSASRPRAHVALSKLTYEPAVAPAGRKGGTRFDQARGFEGRDLCACRPPVEVGAS